MNLRELLENNLFSGTLIKRAMSRNPSDEEIRRVQQTFRRVLGRDLLPDEEKYIGLSSVVMSMDDLEIVGTVVRSKPETAGEDLRTQVN